MRQFHPLEVIAVDRETRDSLRIALEVPDALKPDYAFLPGQHLPVQIKRDGKKLRRTYSICSAPGTWPLELGIRIQDGGQFSEFAANELAAGDQLDAMPPFGQFHANVDAASSKFYLAFAAGSGITPILSIVRTLLRDEPGSRVALFYGNRRQTSTMFIDDLFALKNRYPERLQLQFVFSQEDQEFAIAAGRLDGDKVRDLYAGTCRGMSPDEAFICGPDTMIETVTETLSELGMSAEQLHSERYGVPRRAGERPAPDVASDADRANITVILDGHKKSFAMPASANNFVDAAAEHGIDLPYSCKGGVCATCRCHVRSGEVTMATNYGLEPWEVEKGFILACQSRPETDAVVLDYDKL